MDGGQVILDLNSGCYLVLDALASKMWPAVLDEGAWPTVRRQICCEYEVDEHQLDRDFSAFSADCASRWSLAEIRIAAGLAPSAASSERPSASMPLPSFPRRAWWQRLRYALRACVAIYRTGRSLRREKLRDTYLRYASIKTRHRSLSLDDALTAFAIAEHFFLSRQAPDDCLLRSLSLYRFLREHGVPATHVIGVCRLPFQAHAWVEYGGEPLLGDRAIGGRFTPLSRIPEGPT